MTRDLRLLLWLRGRHLRGRVIYWSALTGADLESGSLMERVYTGYVAVILAGWLVLMLAAAASMANGLGRSVGHAGMASAGGLIALFPLALLAVLAARALRSAPVKLSYPDIAYVGGSALDPRAIALASCLLQAVTYAFAALLVGYLVGSVAVGTGLPERYAIAAGFITALTVAAAVALSWAVGLGRVRNTDRKWPAWSWVVPPVVAVAVALVPWARWPGSALAVALSGGGTAWDIAAIAAVAVAGLGLVAVAARRLDMVAVIEQSALFAQLQVYRPLQLYDPTAYAEIARRKRIATRKPRWRLARGSGALALASRSLLSHARRPSTLLWPVLWGGVLLPAGAWMSLAPHGLLQYFPVVFALLAGPSRQLITVFEADVDRPTLRETLPFDSLSLLAWDSAPTLAIMTLSAAATWAVLRAPLALALPGFLLTALLGVAVVLCRGLERLPLPGLYRQIGYGMTMGVTLAIVFVAGSSGQIVRACVAALAAVAVLVALVRTAGDA